MSTETTTRPHTRTPGLDDPCYAHLHFKSEPHTALCGARIIGIKAGPSRHCPECGRLARELGLK